MFTGIIEAQGVITSIAATGSNLDFTITTPLATELKVDQSLAHNGVCLTVTQIDGQSYTVTAVAETLLKTNLGHWKAGDTVNLERAMIVGGRLDGHFVQGHVDCVATCTQVTTLEGSWLFTFEYPPIHAPLLIEKGSVCINGVSLTVFNVTNATFMVTIIPYTFSHTNFNNIVAGSVVNIEFDVFGKYINRINELK
jgi:riboflavin synthase